MIKHVGTHNLLTLAYWPQSYIHACILGVLLTDTELQAKEEVVSAATCDCCGVGAPGRRHSSFALRPRQYSRQVGGGSAIGCDSVGRNTGMFKFGAKKEVGGTLGQD